MTATSSVARFHPALVFVLIAVYTALLVAAPLTIERFALTGVPRVLLAVSPAVPIITWMVVYALSIASDDELQRLIKLQSLSVTLGVTLAFTLVWGLLEKFAEFPDYPISLLAPLAVVIWWLVSLLATRRFK